MTQTETGSSENISLIFKNLAERVTVILVEPHIEGNIGAVARSMKNAGLVNLILINPTEIGNEAFARTMGGRNILENARVSDSLATVAGEFSVLAGTSSTATINHKKFRRIPVAPWEFWKNNLGTDSKIALVFGREGDGLRNSELEICSQFLFIPANPEYPVYNLSHAVTIVLYEMIRQAIEKEYWENNNEEPIKPENFNLLLKDIYQIMDIVSYPSYKRKNTDVMIRRILGRSALSDTEFYKIMGILKLIRRNLTDEHDTRLER
ncbi:RNA methyltransferase [Oxyplasma meridianum]|uniref:RNA methyltransferase n=1 Tax=Oxyplasma meridianum TaxID=3073602 RepID=A0AAX4NFN3_9ARCH